MIQDDKKAITDYGTTIGLRPRKNWLRTTPLTGSQFIVERGHDPSILVVAFTGFAGKLSIPTSDFLRSTELLNYNRILLRDNSRTCYLNGIPPIAEDVDALTALLRQSIEQLAPKRTMFIGSSGASHAAILFGHLLRADFVHAFSPPTNIDPAYWRATEPPEELAAISDVLTRMDRVPAPARAYFDLRDVLRESNGKTSYNIHVCAQAPSDLARAMRLEGLPGVRIHRYACNHHRVVEWLAREHRLLALLKLENQAALATAAGSEPDAV